MKVKRLSKSLFFVSAFFFAPFSLGSYTLIVETPTPEGSKIVREGRHIYTFERDERLLRGDYIDKTHAHAHITEHQYYYYSLKH
jgi:hypothetical protein